MSKHTPGPWDALFSEHRKPLVVHESASVAIVTEVNFRDMQESNANARLIAAAPDMLTALEELLDEEDLQCSRITNGHCYLRRCCLAGGYKGEGHVHPDMATCPVWRAAQAIDKARGK